MWRQLNWKKSLLVIWKIFWLFMNTYTAGHKFSPLKREKLTQPIQMELSKKQKAFSQNFSCNLEMYRRFWTLSEKRWPSLLMYLGNYEFPKTLLDKCQKCSISEDISTSNMVNEIKQCWNLNSPILPYLLSTVKAIKFEKVSLSER